MKIILLTENTKLSSVQRFSAEATALGHTLISLNPYNGAFPPALPDKTAFVLHRTSGHRLDNHDLACSFYWQAQGHKIINGPDTLLKWRDKELQYALLAPTKIPCVPTLSFRGPWQRSYNDLILQTFKNYLTHDPPQFVLKTNIGSGGLGVSFVTGMDALARTQQKLFSQGDQKYLCQPNLAHALEYRLFYIAEQLQGCLIKKPAPGQVMHNFSQGAQGEFLTAQDCPRQLKTYCQTIQELSKFDYAAVDFFLWQDQFYFLEINFVPGLHAFEVLSKYNIAKNILKNF